MFVIPASVNRPVKFLIKLTSGLVVIRDYLKIFQIKEAKIWNRKTKDIFELQLAKENVDDDTIISLLDTQTLIY
jgi:hypothetical protein